MAEVEHESIHLIVTPMNTTGGATVMGSFPFSRNGMRCEARFGSVVSWTDRSREGEEVYRVREVTGPLALQLNNGLRVRLLGVVPFPGYEQEAAEFLAKIALRQRVRLQFDQPQQDDDGTLLAYVYSENKTFLNAKLIREGYARSDGRGSRSAHLQRCEEEARSKKKGRWAIRLRPPGYRTPRRSPAVP